MMNPNSAMNIENMKTLVNVYGNNSGLNWARFNSCQAWVSELVYNSAFNVMFRLVKSYNTIVGFINVDTAEYIELGKWSRTTSKQVTQIHNQLFRNFERKFIDMYNY